MPPTKDPFDLISAALQPVDGTEVLPAWHPATANPIAISSQTLITAVGDLIDQDFATQNARITASEGDIAVLETEMNTAQADIDTVEARVTQTEADIANIVANSADEVYAEAVNLPVETVAADIAHVLVVDTSSAAEKATPLLVATAQIAATATTAPAGGDLFLGASSGIPRKWTAAQTAGVVYGEANSLGTGTALAKVLGVTGAGAAAGRANADFVTDLLATAGVAAAIGAGATVQHPGVGTQPVTLQAKATNVLHAIDVGAAADGSTDAAAKINLALTAAAAYGNGVVYLAGGTYIIEETLKLPDYVKLKGAGKNFTILKLKNSTNVNIIEKKSGASGTHAALEDLTIDGNDANNTAGGIYWAGSSGARGPTISFRQIRIKNCAPIANAPSGEYAALLTTGSDWGEAVDIDITENQKAVGWWHKGSDWVVDRLFLGPNGATYPTHSLILQGNAGNKFQSCYFGGNGGLSQVLLWGSQRNIFADCQNDNAWQHGYLFDDSSGTPSINNVISGGQLSSSGWSSANTYSMIELNGAASGNQFYGISYLCLQTNKPKYLIEETGTAGGNYVCSGWTDGLFATSVDGRRSGGNSKITALMGFDKSDFGSLLAKTKIDVSGPYDGSAPSTSSVPLLRLNNGGAVSIWAGAQAYTNGWLQAIQDDGSNNLKDLILNPLGGAVITNGNTKPLTDNTVSLGISGTRWTEVFATAGTINTSDRREKEAIRPLHDAELAAAKEIAGIVRAYRFIGKTPTHIGIIAQDLVAVLARHGLDPCEYGMIDYDPTVDRYGVRYDQLACFMLAATRLR